jgi:hypothetical protein
MYTPASASAAPVEDNLNLDSTLHRAIENLSHHTMIQLIAVPKVRIEKLPFWAFFLFSRPICPYLDEFCTDSAGTWLDNSY